MPLDYLFPGPTNAETTWESSRRRVFWAAQASALVAVVSGVTVVLALQWDPPASALDYVATVDFQRSLIEWLVTTFVYSTALSLVLALLARRASALTPAPVGLLILGIVVPGFSRACCGGSESRVIGVLRTINYSQQAYSSSCGNGGYAQSLEDLMRPPVPGGSAFISTQATNKYWYGYTITMIPAPGAAVVTLATATCNQARADLMSGYFVEAHPTVSAPGRRSFATDERGTVYVNQSGALIQPRMVGAEPFQ